MEAVAQLNRRFGFGLLVREPPWEGTPIPYGRSASMASVTVNFCS